MRGLVLCPDMDYTSTSISHSFALPRCSRLCFPYCFYTIIQLGIAARLGNPSHAMQVVYGIMVIQAVQYAAQLLAATLLACLIPCIVVWLSRELCVIHVVELEE